MKKILKRATAAALTGLLTVSMAVPALAADTAHKTDEVTELETINSGLSKAAALEGMVLLENNGVLPIASSGKIALFGQGAYRTIKGGTGSGDVNQRSVVTVRDAFKDAGFEITTEGYMDAALADYNAKLEAWSALPHASRWETYKHEDLTITAEELETAKAADTAVYVIARNSGEGDDRLIQVGDYWLSDGEIANLKTLGENFEKVIVCLNVGGMMDTSFFNGIGDAQEKIEGLDALLLMSQGGQEIGSALVEIMTGKATPSGKLTDTWAANYSDYPAGAHVGNADGDGINEYYHEGVYVGYRWFDTFGKEVAYPFGYGKSYTDFSIELGEVKADMDKVSVTATVTNTGDTYSGKEVVEVYFSAPMDDEDDLDVPYQELAAYGKTRLLAPGESQTLTLSFRTTEMSSYSEEKDAYVMNDGDYVIRVGNSSRNTHVAAVLTLAEDTVTEQLSHQFTEASFEEGKGLNKVENDGSKHISYEGEAEEIAAAAKIALDTTGFEAANNASPYGEQKVVSYVFEGSAYQPSGLWNETVEVVENIPEGVPATLKSVHDGKISMEQFLASLSVEEMANIVNGNRNSAPSEPIIGAQANSVLGAAGETTSLYYETREIPNIVLADGPAGIRITQSYTDANDGKPYYQFCTAWPIGTMLAQTWNPEVVQTVGEGIGSEMVEYGVTLWLAPGMNIHRDPLCGRNFEYYSEDPFITGTMGAAATAGVQSNPGIGVTIKHFAGNNQEVNRNTQNNTVSERAFREIYLKGFEMVVKSAQPMAIMTSYNYNNNVYASEDYHLLAEVTRGEWGFHGLVMTDWGAGSRSTIQGQMHAGNDLIMPGGQQARIVNAFDDDPSNEATLANGTTDAAIALGDLQACTARILNILMQSSQFAKMFEDVEAVPYTAPGLTVYQTVE